MRAKKSIFVVSDLLWRDSFTSQHSLHYSWHILTKIPFHRGPPWSVYSLTRFSPFQLLCMAARFITNALIAARPRYVPFFPSQAKLHCEICQLTLAQPCLTTSQSIFIQANFTDALTLVHSFCVRYKRFETLGFCRQVKPTRGQWRFSGVGWPAPTHCRQNRMSSRTQDA